MLQVVRLRRAEAVHVKERFTAETIELGDGNEHGRAGFIRERHGS
jgi:hypothetical protein